MSSIAAQYLVIADGLSYKLAKVLENHKNHYQVELLEDNSKKKVKSTQLIYQLTPGINITQFSTQVQQIQDSIDTELLAELINEDDKMSLEQLSLLYFGEDAGLAEKTALLFNLAQENSVFNNFLNGSFSKCSPEEQQQRLLVMQKQQQAQEQYAYYRNLFLEALNSNIKLKDTNIDAFRLLHRPDKHSAAYKAMNHLTLELKLTAVEICDKLGLIDNLAEFYIGCFTRDNFPQGINNSIDTIKPDLDGITERLDLNVFSIDDSTTTEIDDAFSVETTESGYIIGVHIAAPALNNDLAETVAENISTVYYPGGKITMLPENIISHYSLWENTIAPVVSIYFELDSDLGIVDYYSSVNVIKIAANLRIEALETLFNHENLETDHGYPFESDLKLLYKFAGKLEEKRGKPSIGNLIPDYNFSFDQDKIVIKPRQRGNPIDKLVSELMILANCSWGRLLTNSFIPAIYRVKQPGYPVKMTLTPASHTGLNVDYYTWSTSPLRRASDFINQKQIISMVRKSKDAYTALDPTLLEVVDNFDTKYAKYIDFQNKMERYWSLQYLIQEQINEINAIFTYKSTVHLEGIPIDIDVSNFTAQQPRGSIIRLKIFNINPATINFDFKIMADSSQVAHA